MTEEHVFTRYRDVAAALRDSRLVPWSPLSGAAPAVFNRAAHADFRADALRAVPPAKLAEWEAQFAPLAGEMAQALPAGEPFDLIDRFANPWSSRVAAMAAGPCGDRREIAARIFDAACEPYDRTLGAAALDATAELARSLCNASPVAVQMFVALACSLPAFLGNAWLTLLEQPDAPARLRADPSLLSQAMEELARLAGPAKVQFRQAAAPLTIGDRAIPPGAHVSLRLDLANRDPEIFPAPGRLDFSRPPGHLAFGGGTHACIGASLVKSAAASATRALLARFQSIEKLDAVPAERFAIRYLERLTVLGH